MEDVKSFIKFFFPKYDDSTKQIPLLFIHFIYFKIVLALTVVYARMLLTEIPDFLYFSSLVLIMVNRDTVIRGYSEKK